MRRISVDECHSKVRQPGDIVPSHVALAGSWEQSKAPLRQLAISQVYSAISPWESHLVWLEPLFFKLLQEFRASAFGYYV